MDRSTTDWNPALTEAVHETDRGDVLAVVVLSDGRRNGPSPSPDSDPVDGLAARGVPVDAVLVGSTRPPRDAAIESIEAPESVFPGDVAEVTVRLKLDGYPGRSTTVRLELERPGDPPLRLSQVVPATGPDRASLPTVTFRVPFEATPHDRNGPVLLTLALDPLPGDTRPDNDRGVVTVAVNDDKARVLLVDGTTRWEFRYLHDALVRDRQVRLDTVVFQQPSNESMTSLTYPNTLPTTVSGAEALNAYDVIIVGDVAPVDLSSTAWARLASFVADRGGTLVLSAGPRSGRVLTANPRARACCRCWICSP